MQVDYQAVAIIEAKRNISSVTALTDFLMIKIEMYTSFNVYIFVKIQCGANTYLW